VSPGTVTASCCCWEGGSRDDFVQVSPVTGLTAFVPWLLAVDQPPPHAKQQLPPTARSKRVGRQRVGPHASWDPHSSSLLPARSTVPLDLHPSRPHAQTFRRARPYVIYSAGGYFAAGRAIPSWLGRPIGTRRGAATVHAAAVAGEGRSQRLPATRQTFDGRR
jgi:hypothetical protein